MGFVKQCYKLPNFISQFFEKLPVVREPGFSNVVNDFFFYILVKNFKELSGLY